MNVIMDNRLKEIDKEEEVRKLQELVKKLEIQNEELRSERQALLNKEKINPELLDDQINGSSLEIKKCTLDADSKEKLDLEKLQLEHEYQLSDEETWLFNSPKTQVQSNEWLRKDVDDPLLVTVKKSLVNKLDEIANSPRHSPRHSLYSPSSSSGVLSPESPPSSRGEIDTRTFIRPKKRRSLALENKIERSSAIKESNGVSSTLEHSRNKQNCIVQSNGSLGSEDEDRLSSASDGSYSSFKLADVEDVNNLARLQEESLKLPEASPLSRLQGMRNSTERLNSPNQLSRMRQPAGSSGGSGGSATSSQEDLLNNTFSVHCSPRRVIPRSSLQPPKTYMLPHHTSRESSDVSTPPDSPYNSQNDLQSSNARPGSSRLPSLTRRLGKPESRFLDNQSSPTNSRGSSPLPSQEYGRTHDARPIGRTTRLQTPQVKSASRLSAPSPVRIPMSNQLNEIPRSKATEGPPKQAFSALPKPGSRLQAPRPRPSQSPSGHSGGDWREGCY